MKDGGTVMIEGDGGISKRARRNIVLMLAMLFAFIAHHANAADSYTSSCRIVQQVTGSNDNTWGTKANAAFAMLDECIAKVTSISVTGANVTLSTANNATDQSRSAVLIFTGTPGTTRTVTAPNVQKTYWVLNNSDSTITFGSGGGTTVTIPSLGHGYIYDDGATNSVGDVFSAFIYTLLDDANAAAARSTLGTAASGANTDITSLYLNNTGLKIKDTNASHGLSLVPGSDITADRTLTLTTGDASRVLSLAGDLTTAAAFTTSGANALTLTTTGVTNVTLPTSGTLLTTASSLAPFAATTSAELAAVISNETGTGALVFGTSPTLVTPALGTPASGVLTNATGLPLTTGVTGTLPVANGGTGVTTSTGSGNNVLSTSPTLVTPILGTPTSGVLTNATGLPLTTGVTGTLPVANGGTGVTTSTGSGNVVLSTSPTLVTPILGTPTSGTLTNATGLPLTTGITGTLGVANGGTGITSFGTGVATFLGTPTTANLASMVTGETGSGAVVFGTSPTITTATLTSPDITIATAGSFTAPSFRLELSAQASNVTGDGTNYSIAWDTEIWDTGNNVSAGVFTAPITGKYTFTLQVNAIGFSASADVMQLTLHVAGGSDYSSVIGNPTNMKDATTGQLTGTMTQIIPMTAGQTLTAQIQVSHGTKTTSVRNISSFFGGYLIPG